MKAIVVLLACILAFPIFAAGTAQAASATWTVEFEYYNTDLSYPYQYTDCFSANVELWKLGWWWEKIETKTTNANGQVSFTVNTGGTYKAKILTDGATLKVSHSGTASAPLSWETPSQYISGTSTYHHHIPIEANNHYKQWNIYLSLVDARNYVAGFGGWPCDHITVYTEQPMIDNSYFKYDIFGGHWIELESDASFSRGMAWHEFGHCIQYHCRSSTNLPGPAVADHDLETETNVGNAITEGWAEFFHAVMHERTWPGNLIFEIESGPSGTHCWADEIDIDWDGNIVEGSVAQIFWDIYDPYNAADKYAYAAYGDLIASRFDRLWSVMLNDDPDHMTEFYDQWCDRFYGGADDSNLNWIYYNMRIDL